MKLLGKSRQLAKNLKKDMNIRKNKVDLFGGVGGEANEISKGESYSI